MAQDVSSTNRWHSIRPWAPRLTLSVRELTSVSATFILSFLSSHRNLALILEGEAAHSDDDDDDDDHNEAELPGGAEHPTLATGSGSRSQRIISDALSKGLSVTVNGAPWQRVLIRVDDEADEAVIIIYGLMPGRQYDIELGIVPGDERFKGQATTTEARDGDNSAEHGDRHHSSTTVSAPSPSRPPSPTPSGNSHQPLHPTQPTAPQTIEEYIAILSANLTALQAENASLLGTLKQTRRDAQKSSSAIKADIASLKKASQKHSTADARARQKVKALEEAVKQSVRGKEEIEEETVVLEEERKTKERDLASIEARCNGVKDRAAEWKARREKAEADNVKRLAGVKAELASLDARVEKLRARKDKLAGQTPTELDEIDRSSDEEGVQEASKGEKEEDPEQVKEEDKLPSGGIVGELEDKLRDLQLERERIEADPYGYLASTQPDIEDDVVVPSDSSTSDLSSGFTPHTNLPIPTSASTNVFPHNPRLQPHSSFASSPHVFGPPLTHMAHHPHNHQRGPPVMLNKRHVPFTASHHPHHNIHHGHHAQHHARHTGSLSNVNAFNVNPNLNLMSSNPVNAMAPRSIGPVQRPHQGLVLPVNMGPPKLPGNAGKPSPPLPTPAMNVAGIGSSSNTGTVQGSTLSGFAAPFEPASIRGGSVPQQ